MCTCKSVNIENDRTITESIQSPPEGIRGVSIISNSYDLYRFPTDFYLKRGWAKAFKDGSRTALVLIKLTKNAVPLRFRCGSCKLKLCRYFTMFCDI